METNTGRDGGREKGVDNHRKFIRIVFVGLATFFYQLIVEAWEMENAFQKPIMVPPLLSI